VAVREDGVGGQELGEKNDDEGEEYPGSGGSFQRAEEHRSPAKG
jgi:hypothetical protein